MARSTVFDTSAFLETNYKLGDFPTDWQLPDIGDYAAQVDAPTGREPIRFEVGTSSAGRLWAKFTISWRITDESVGAKLNMKDVFVSQPIMVDLVDGSTETHPQIDMGQNRSQRLKDLWKAVGLLDTKRGGSVSMSKVKFATGIVHVEHRRPDGFDRDIAEVTRVAPANGAA